MIGPQLTAADVNATCAQIVRQVYSAMDNVRRFEAFLAATSLQAAPYGMTAADESQMKSTFTDLDKLRTIFEGTATQATNYDFRTFAKQALGTGLY